MPDYNQLLLDIPAYMQNANLASTDADWGATVTNSIIPTAELRLSRDLRVAGFQTEVMGTIALGANSFPRPADLVSLDVMLVTVNGFQTPLQLKQAEYVYEYISGGAAAGAPKYYAIKDGSTYLTAPVADAAYPYELNYTRRLPSLSLAVPTNWITVNAYDCLLAACLAEASRFVQDDRAQTSMISAWEGKYQTLVAAINDAETRADRDDFRVPFVQAANS